MDEDPQGMGSSNIAKSLGHSVSRTAELQFSYIPTSTPQLNFNGSFPEFPESTHSQCLQKKFDRQRPVPRFGSHGADTAFLDFSGRLLQCGGFKEVESGRF